MSEISKCADFDVVRVDTGYRFWQHLTYGLLRLNSIAVVRRATIIQMHVDNSVIYNIQTLGLLEEVKQFSKIAIRPFNQLFVFQILTINWREKYSKIIQEYIPYGKIIAISIL